MDSGALEGGWESRQAEIVENAKDVAGIKASNVASVHQCKMDIDSQRYGCHKWEVMEQKDERRDLTKRGTARSLNARYSLSIGSSRPVPASLPHLTLVVVEDTC